VDLITAGFPCQPSSAAGKGLGVDDPRWLWPQVQRICGEASPGLVFLENVPGIRTKGLVEVLEGLADLGFDAWWDCFSAAEVGAPHLRRRWFCLAAHPERADLRDLWQWVPGGRQGGLRAPGDAEPQHDGADGDVAISECIGRPRVEDPATGNDSDGSNARRKEKAGRVEQRSETVADAEGARLQEWPLSPDDEATEQRPLAGPGEGGWWSAEPDVGRVADGVADRVDRLRSIGNGVVPLVVAHAFRTLAARAAGVD